MAEVPEPAGEDNKKEEQGETSRWLLEEILGEQPRNLMANRALFDAEETGFGGYGSDGEREVFFQGGGWSESEAEAKEVNQVYKVVGSP